VSIRKSPGKRKRAGRSHCARRKIRQTGKGVLRSSPVGVSRPVFRVGAKAIEDAAVRHSICGGLGMIVPQAPAPDLPGSPAIGFRLRAIAARVLDAAQIVIDSSGIEGIVAARGSKQPERPGDTELSPCQTARSICTRCPLAYVKDSAKQAGIPSSNSRPTIPAIGRPPRCDSCVHPPITIRGDRLLGKAMRRRPARVAPDGSSVAYNSADGHFSVNRYVLTLVRPTSAKELPHATGAPRQVTFGKGRWHVHGGAWSPDGRWIVYTRDFDRGNLSVINNYR
jgi:hypothetical protein